MKGTITVLAGPMFSGKTETLIKRVKGAEIAKLQVQVFKPMLDNRNGHRNVVSHNGSKVKAIAVTDPVDLLMEWRRVPMVAVDEAQFFDLRIVDIVHILASEGSHVLLAGLDLDFRGEPFGSMPQLMQMADEVRVLAAKCSICGEGAAMSQRTVNGAPAKWNDPVVVIGAEEKYEPRCRTCHVIERPS